MAMCKYNGVRLREAPEWDHSTHPYAIVYYVVNENGVDEAHFGYSNQPFYLDTSQNLVTNPQGAEIYASIYNAEKCEWGEIYLFYGAAFALDPEKVIWGNEDVLDDTGELFLAGSDPVKLFPLRKWTGRLLAGLCSRPLPLRAREPVAYLYNGVRLPALPEWDRVKYPYGTIIRITVGANQYNYMFICTDAKFISAGYSFLPNQVAIGTEDGKCAYCSWKYLESHSAEFVWEFSFENEHGDPLLGMSESAVWATYDIDCTGVGGNYISASDPIPVYE